MLMPTAVSDRLGWLIYVWSRGVTKTCTFLIKNLRGIYYKD